MGRRATVRHGMAGRSCRPSLGPMVVIRLRRAARAPRRADPCEPCVLRRPRRRSHAVVALADATPVGTASLAPGDRVHALRDAGARDSPRGPLPAGALLRMALRIGGPLRARRTSVPGSVTHSRPRTHECPPVETDRVPTLPTKTRPAGRVAEDDGKPLWFSQEHRVPRRSRQPKFPRNRDSVIHDRRDTDRERGWLGYEAATVLARVQLARGRAEDASTFYSASGIEGLVMPAVVSEAFLVEAEVRLDLGEVEVARAVLRDGRDRIVRIAATVPDPAPPSSFLALEANARRLALASKWLGD
jgi:hypothetical protein